MLHYNYLLYYKLSLSNILTIYYNLLLSFLKVSCCCIIVVVLLLFIVVVVVTVVVIGLLFAIYGGVGVRHVFIRFYFIYLFIFWMCWACICPALFIYLFLSVFGMYYPSFIVGCVRYCPVLFIFGCVRYIYSGFIYFWVC